jgi:NADPH-dependent curcumin reductase CurA
LCKRETKPLFKVPLFEIGDPNIPLLLSIYGVTGLTALNGMKLIPEDHRPTKENPKVFCVSSAAGSTGSIAL